MLGLAVVLSIASLCLLTALPRFTLIFMIIFGILATIGVSGLFFYIGYFLPAAIVLAIAFIILLVILCSFKKIKIGLSLLSIASKFLKSRPSLYVSPFVLLIFISPFFLFWAMSFSGIILYRGVAQT
jgi:hypothetical protein